jgi:hypothetical protein
VSGTIPGRGVKCFVEVGTRPLPSLMWRLLIDCWLNDEGGVFIWMRARATAASAGYTTTLHCTLLLFLGAFVGAHSLVYRVALQAVELLPSTSLSAYTSKLEAKG